MNIDTRRALEIAIIRYERDRRIAAALAAAAERRSTRSN
jgi:hypothetical protein